MANYMWPLLSIWLDLSFDADNCVHQQLPHTLNLFMRIDADDDDVCWSQFESVGDG